MTKTCVSSKLLLPDTLKFIPQATYFPPFKKKHTGTQTQQIRRSTLPYSTDHVCYQHTERKTCSLAVTTARRERSWHPFSVHYMPGAVWSMVAHHVPRQSCDYSHFMKLETKQNKKFRMRKKESRFSPILNVFKHLGIKCSGSAINRNWIVKLFSFRYSSKSRNMYFIYIHSPLWIHLGIKQKRKVTFNLISCNFPPIRKSYIGKIVFAPRSWDHFLERDTISEQSVLWQALLHKHYQREESQALLTF